MQPFFLFVPMQGYWCYFCVDVVFVGMLGVVDWIDKQSVELGFWIGRGHCYRGTYLR